MGKPKRNKEQVRSPASSQETTVPSLPGLLTHPLTALLLIGLLATAIYSNTFSAAFHFDDVQNLVDNPKIKHLTHFLDLSGNRYVGFLSFALNYHFGGLNVFGYHLVNLLIHITNGFLVYLLVRLLFRAVHSPIINRYSLNVNRDPVSIHDSQLVAIVTALLFVAHPIQTQAVTYIVQRFASLAALFYLLTLVFYLQWRLSPPGAKGRTLRCVGALFTTLLAMKTKETTFTLPFMLLLLEAVFFSHAPRKRWAALIPFLLTLPLIPWSHPGAIGEGEAGLLPRETLGISRGDYLLTQFRVIVTYLRLLFFPVHQNLDYDYPIHHSLSEPSVFLSFLFLSALFALAIYLLLSSRLTPSASRLTAFGILWFFLTLSIESSIIPIRDVIYEHRLYLPSVGIWLAAGTTLFAFSNRWRVWKAIGVGGLLVILSVATYQRNTVWKDEVTLWTDVIRQSPHKARGYNNLGVAYAAQDRLTEAISEYNTALSLRPDYPDAHNNLGNALEGVGRLDEAIQEYKTVLTLKPRYPKGYYNLGLFYYKQGDLSKALGALEGAVQIDPEYAEAHNNLVVLYKEMGKYKDAIQEYKTAISLKPEYAEPHNNLGIVYKNISRFDQAISEYQSALALNPNFAEVHNNLGVLYKKLERPDEAIQEYKTASILKPESAEIHNNLGNAYQEQKQLEEAIREYKAALSLQPDYFEAHYNLGLSYYEQDDVSTAIEEFKEAIKLKPGHAEAHNSIGVIYMEQGRLKDALQEFKTALRLRPTLAEAYYNLGDDYQRLGEIRKAIPAFEGALKIQPDYEKASRALDSLRR